MKINVVEIKPFCTLDLAKNLLEIYSRQYSQSDDCEAGVRFVNHEYDDRLNWTTRSPVTN